MTPIGMAAFGAVAVFLVGVVVFVLAQATLNRRRYRERLADDWGRIANALELHVIPTPSSDAVRLGLMKGTRHNDKRQRPGLRVSPTLSDNASKLVLMEGTYDGASVTASAEQLTRSNVPETATDEKVMLRTTLRARFDAPLGLGLTMQPKSKLAHHVGEGLGVLKELKTGDAAFDDAVWLRAEADVEDVLKLLTPEVRASVVRGFQQHLDSVDDTGAALSLVGPAVRDVEAFEVHLREAVEAMRVIARAKRDADAVQAGVRVAHAAEGGTSAVQADNADARDRAPKAAPEAAPEAVPEVVPEAVSVGVGVQHER